MIIPAVVKSLCNQLEYPSQTIVRSWHIGVDYIFLGTLVGPVLIPHLKVIL